MSEPAGGGRPRTSSFEGRYAKKHGKLVDSFKVWLEDSKASHPAMKEKTVASYCSKLIGEVKAVKELREKPLCVKTVDGAVDTLEVFTEMRDKCTDVKYKLMYKYMVDCMERLLFDLRNEQQKQQQRQQQRQQQQQQQQEPPPPPQQQPQPDGQEGGGQGVNAAPATAGAAGAQMGERQAGAGAQRQGGGGRGAAAATGGGGGDGGGGGSNGAEMKELRAKCKQLQEVKDGLVEQLKVVTEDCTHQRQRKEHFKASWKEAKEKCKRLRAEAEESSGAGADAGAGGAVQSLPSSYENEKRKWKEQNDLLLESWQRAATEKKQVEMENQRLKAQLDMLKEEQQHRHQQYRGDGPASSTHQVGRSPRRAWTSSPTSPGRGRGGGGLGEDIMAPLGIVANSSGGGGGVSGGRRSPSLSSSSSHCPPPSSDSPPSAKSLEPPTLPSTITSSAAASRSEPRSGGGGGGGAAMDVRSGHHHRGHDRGGYETGDKKRRERSRSRSPHRDRHRRRTSGTREEERPPTPRSQYQTGRREEGRRSRSRGRGSGGGGGGGGGGDGDSMRTTRWDRGGSRERGGREEKTGGSERGSWLPPARQEVRRDRDRGSQGYHGGERRRDEVVVQQRQTLPPPPLTQPPPPGDGNKAGGTNTH